VTLLFLVGCAFYKLSSDSGSSSERQQISL